MRLHAGDRHVDHHLLHSNLWCRLAFGMRAALRYAAAPETQQQFQAMLIAASLLFLPSAAAAARRSDSVPPAAQPARRAFARGLRARAPARPQQTSLLRWIAVAPSYQCGTAHMLGMAQCECAQRIPFIRQLAQGLWSSRDGDRAARSVHCLCLAFLSRSRKQHKAENKKAAGFHTGLFF